jgi:hypothetical protein
MSVIENEDIQRTIVRLAHDQSLIPLNGEPAMLMIEERLN